jgi:hypothetical protein
MEHDYWYKKVRRGYRLSSSGTASTIVKVGWKQDMKTLWRARQWDRCSDCPNANTWVAAVGHHAIQRDDSEFGIPENLYPLGSPSAYGWTQNDWELLSHPSYSPDLAPSHYHLFGPLKDHLRGHHWLRGAGTDFCHRGTIKILQRWRFCRKVIKDD